MGREEVQACLCLSPSLSPFFLGSHRPAFHKLCTPIYTLLPLSDFNGVCLSPIEKKRESSSLRRRRLLWKCTFISKQCSRVLVCKDMGEHAWNRRDVVDNRPPAAFSTQSGNFFPFPSFFLSQGFYCARIVSYLEICKDKSQCNLYFSRIYSNNLNIFSCKGLLVLLSISPVYDTGNKEGICDTGCVTDTWV